MDKAQIPLDVVDADKLPIEHPITYDEICRIIGSLYLDGIRKSKGIEGQAKNLLNQLNGQMELLREENSKLKKQISELDKELPTEEVSVG